MYKVPVFHSNKKYWMFLNKLVFGDSINCPICSCHMRQNYKQKYLWCSGCRRKYSPTAHKGSWLYGMKLSYRQLFMLLWCWQNKMSPGTTRLKAELSYTTVQRWYERFRIHTPESIVQLTDLIQADESYFGKQKSVQDQLIVVGAINPVTRQVALRITNSRSQESIESFVQDYVAQGALIVSDKWYAYQELPLLGYSHESWNHSLGHFAGTNQIEGLWSSIKRYLRKLYGCVPTKQLQSILNEWTARLNRPDLFTSPENYLQECLFRVS